MALALEIGRRGGKAAVINADSAQVYRDLAVLSARPNAEEMRGVPHLLFGTWDGAMACSAADWAAAARQEIARLHDEGAVPVLAGGTGLYLRTLLDGIAPIPAIDPAIREEVRALPTPEAYAQLQNADPERAAALNPADSTRIARALEVVRSTGRPLAHWHSRREGGIGADIALFPLILLPEREALYARCGLRFEQMMEQGAAAEVEALLARGLPPALPVMRAIGVPEIAGWLRGDWSREEAVARAQQATRNYAKRQFTWFRHQPPEEWVRKHLEDVVMTEDFETLFLHHGLT